MNQRPILYSFRRCPFAISARIALFLSGIKIELREVLLRDKPEEMLKLSSKATVPILLLPNGDIIDESLEIMSWALLQNDPLNLLDLTHIQESIGNDISQGISSLNTNIRKYKFIDQNKKVNLEQLEKPLIDCLSKYNELLMTQKYLVCDQIKIYDYVLFPFIRQIISHNRNLLDVRHFDSLFSWHDNIINSNSFKLVMPKYKIWEKYSQPIYFP